MKIRPVFSVLILAFSAFSYYRMIGVNFSTGTISTVSGATSTDFVSIYVFDGQCLFCRYYDSPTEQEFEFATIDTDESSYWNGFFLRLPYQHRFLCFAHTTPIGFHGGKASIYLAPLWSFLFLPMMWMCGVYLFRLRGFIQARRAEENQRCQVSFN